MNWLKKKTLSDYHFICQALQGQKGYQCKFVPFIINTGIVPLPETAIDFSDLRSQSNRLNDRVSVAGLCTPITVVIVLI